MGALSRSLWDLLSPSLFSQLIVRLISFDHTVFCVTWWRNSFCSSWSFQPNFRPDDDHFASRNDPLFNCPFLGVISMRGSKGITTETLGSAFGHFQRPFARIGVECDGTTLDNLWRNQRMFQLKHMQTENVNTHRRTCRRIRYGLGEEDWKKRRIEE